MKNMDEFHSEMTPSRTTTKLALFTVSKGEWNTKEGTGTVSPSQHLLHPYYYGS